MMKIFHLHLLFNTVLSVAEQREAKNLLLILPSGITIPVIPSRRVERRELRDES